MADLLASLEVGITRTVGATQRLRSQITRIDEYMAAQRQQDQFSYSHSHSHSQSQSHSQTGPPGPHGPGSSVSDSIDPSLRVNHDANTNGGLGGDQGQQIWQQQTPDSYGYLTGSTAPGDLGAGGEQFQFQLPPELLEGWPWPFDMTQGFGNF
jgi:hypothetical protein